MIQEEWKRKWERIYIKNMNKEKRREYFNTKQREYRKNKIMQKVYLQRGQWRYIDEKHIFTPEDYEYLTSIEWNILAKTLQ